jgi:UDP-glucose:(heptosyl)LPS alpha-1,3-glucosyltransferase
MKILYVLSKVSKRGGIARYVSHLAEEFAKSEKDEVHALVFNYENLPKNVILHQHHMIFSPTWLHVAANAVDNVSDIKKLREELGIDIVHSQGAESYEQDVLTAHSCQIAAVSQLRKIRRGVYSLLKPFEPTSNVVLAIERHNYLKRKYKKVISVSQGVKRELMQYYGVPDEDIVVIPNGVDLEEFNPFNVVLYRSEMRKYLKIDENDVVLIFTAWEFNRKGLRHVIDSLTYLPHYVKLIVVGGDDSSKYIQQAIQLKVKDRIIFVGQQTDVKKYYAASDIFVFPTEYEAFSIATLEAAASGLPLLMTKVNGTEELLVDGINGFFIERDGRDISEKILETVNRGMIYMGRNARRSAEHYGWKSIAEQTKAVYNEVIQ